LIVVCEPQCKGFAHEQVNAGFLAGYLTGYPQDKIEYFAEAGHAACVGALLAEAGVDASRLSVQPIEPPAADSLREALPAYFRLFRRILRFCLKHGVSRLVLLSAHSYNLIPLKLLRIRRPELRVHIVVHGALEGIRRTSRRLYDRLFRPALALGGNRGVRYIVLSGSVLANSRKYLGASRRSFVAVDHPYLFRPIPSTVPAAARDENLVLATLGKGNARMAEELAELLAGDGLGDRFSIRMIGGMHRRPVAGPKQIEYPVTARRYARREMDELVSDVRFVLFLYAPRSYELTVSGAFFDALSYGKPMVFLSNRCMDPYFEEYRFGIQCEALDEMRAQVARWIEAPDAETYEAFVAEIRRMRRDVSLDAHLDKLAFD
jgi:hypothetical protein